MTAMQLSAEARGMLLLADGPQGPAPLPDCAHRGHVDALDPAAGLRGWLADSTGRPAPEVELWVDDECVAAVRPTGDRPDIWPQAPAGWPAAFGFDLDLLLRVAARTDLSPTSALRVRPAGGPGWLPGAAPWTLADLQLLRVPLPAQPYLAGGDGPLDDELRRLARLAFRQALQPLRTDPRRHAGVLESAVPLGRSRWLVNGWMLDEIPPLCGLLLTTRGRRRGAALGSVRARRPDLPDNARAFFGVLHGEDGLDAVDLDDQSQWLVAGQALAWLAPVPAMRRPTLEAALAEAEALFAPADSARGRELLALVRAAQPWDLAAHRGGSGGAQAAVDQALLAPGFGLFVSGWQVHPMSHPRHIDARVGGASFTLDPATLHLGPRPDLAAAVPGAGGRTALAGFGAVLRGDDPPAADGPALLRLHYADGATLLLELPATALRRVDADLPPARLEALTPGTEWAPWLPDLVAAVAAADARDALARLHWLRPAALPRVLVRVLPQAAAAQRLALDGLMPALPMLQRAGAGLLVLQPATLAPGLWSAWQAAAAGAAPHLPMAAARLLRAADAWPLLPHLLAQVQARRFVFLGPEVQPTAAGLTEARAFLCDDDADAAPGAPPPPRLLTVESLRGDHAVLSHEAQAFGWTADALAAHWRDAPPRWPGLRGLHGLPAPARPPAGPVHAHRVVPAAADPVAARWDARVATATAPQGAA